MRIRPATPEDVPAVLPMIDKICALHKAWDSAKYGFLPEPAKRYRRWLTKESTNPKSVFLVAESTTAELATQLMGFLMATTELEIPIYDLQEFGFIHDIWVEPDYRHQGIAHQLIQQAIDRFRQIGVQQIRLDTVVANESARQLFTSFGFRASTIEMLLELDPNI